ncbi:hypothetical protein PBI_LUCKY2013_178 [Mycobacterium phage Lucky2013]|nr:hypothetical protein PORCELAIN_182 [Mycobacterium phage Porcelain]ASD53571.1 hypothetical protein PBI_LUCKY2013_178 [Mycobacterium phage Lucky2013]
MSIIEDLMLLEDLRGAMETPLDMSVFTGGNIVKYYPRRKDGVCAIRFDGSHESAQKIARAIGKTVQHEIPADVLPGDTGGTLTIPGESCSVRPGDVVVVFDMAHIEYRDGTVLSRKFSVMSAERFDKEYSLNGL